MTTPTTAPTQPEPDWHRAFRSAIDDLLRQPDARSLGIKLREDRGRVVGGLVLDAPRGKSEYGRRWAAFPATEYYEQSTPAVTYADGPT